MLLTVHELVGADGSGAPATLSELGRGVFDRLVAVDDQVVLSTNGHLCPTGRTSVTDDAGHTVDLHLANPQDRYDGRAAMVRLHPVDLERSVIDVETINPFSEVMTYDDVDELDHREIELTSDADRFSVPLVAGRRGAAAGALSVSSDHHPGSPSRSSVRSSDGQSAGDHLTTAPGAPLDAMRALPGFTVELFVTLPDDGDAAWSSVLSRVGSAGDAGRTGGCSTTDGGARRRRGGRRAPREVGQRRARRGPGAGPDRVPRHRLTLPGRSAGTAGLAVVTRSVPQDGDVSPFLAPSTALALLSSGSSTSRVTADSLSGGSDAVRFLGVTLVGVSATTGVKLLFTGVLVLVVLLIRRMVLWAFRRVLGGEVADPRRFWARQVLQVVVAVALVLGIVSIWITPGTDITTGIGLISAGLAFALQQVILSLAAYVVILRGDVFSIGDRVEMGGVRGDVVRLGFLKTTVMEMGQPPSVASADPAVWVHSRQYTGRIVTVTNGVIFDEPVYNYTRDWPYIWEEIVLPIAYTDDRARVEQVLLAAARDHDVVDQESVAASLASMRSRYAMADASTEPTVYWRITDNWLELSLRFLTLARGVRDVKDAMSRQILTELDGEGIGIASATYEVVKVPPLRLERPDGGF